MTAQMTYATLITDLEAYLERTDSALVAQAPRLVMLAESTLSREVKCLGQLNFVTDAFVAGNSVYPKPTRWRETGYFNFGSGTGNNTRNTLRLRDYGYLRRYWPDPTQTGTPKFYADYDYNHFLIAPTPVAANPFEIGFYELVQPLDATNQTNWLTDFAPDLLLYACLLQTAPYLKNDERLPLWQQMYQGAVSSIQKQQTKRLIDQSQSNSGGS